MNRLFISDYIVFSIGVILLMFIGYIKGKDNKNADDFFLALRKTPVVVSVFSFVATEISAMTIVGVPAISFKDNWSYLQFFIGSAISRVIIAYFFIPVFYRYNCTTIYDFIGKRFSKNVQYTSTIFFFITRLLSSGIRLYATSLALSVILGIKLETSIIMFLIIAFVFIGFGGIKSVLYTGVYQALTFYLMAIMVLCYILLFSNICFSNFFTCLAESDKLLIFKLGLNFREPDILLLAVLNGVFGSLASFGTDYEMMQRLLTLKTSKESQKSIVYTVVATLILVILYLSVGSAIYAFLKISFIDYNDNPDKIISYFALNFLPHPLVGFVFLTIFLASIDLPLVSLSTSFVNDIYKNVAKVYDDKKLIKLSRISMIFFAIILGLIAYLSRHVQSMLWFAFEINGITSGSLLGVFLLGIFSKTNMPVLIISSMIFSSSLCLTFMITNRAGITTVPWSLFVVIGCVLSFSIPFLVSKIKEKVTHEN